MGNASSLSATLSNSPEDKSSSGKKGRSSSSKTSSAAAQAAESATERAKKVFGDVQESFKSGVKRLEEQDHPAAHLIDSVCGPILFDDGDGKRSSRKMRDSRSASFYSEDYNSDDSRTISEDDQTLDTDYNQSTVNGSTVASSAAPNTKSRKEDESYLSQSDYEPDDRTGRRKKRDRHHHRRHGHGGEDETDDDSKTMDTTSAGPGQPPAQLLAKPLASSFAKRCYFTKAGIGKTTQHYEGLTLTGNVVLMLAAAMKLKGCPTICDEDLRRVEQTYPNQFSRLPDELLLSSGWRRISKYCHFSNKPIPDGIPFFHSKQRLHPQGGFYFLLAAAVGMVRPIDVEPLTRDTLVLLETDYPNQCDDAPEVLIQDPDQWTLVDKFCFFSGGPINTEEDVYYQADFDGNPIYMLAFLSPSLTPEELYKLDEANNTTGGEIDGEFMGLTSVAAVQEVESVYDLTERDFHDLKLYHLGPCRALPQYILQPNAWAKVLPPHFLDARHRAILRAQEYELQNGGPSTPNTQLTAQRTVGAAPIDGRYDSYGPPDAHPSPHHHTPTSQPMYDEYGNPVNHHFNGHHHPGGMNRPDQNNGYYMPTSGEGMPDGGVDHSSTAMMTGSPMVAGGDHHQGFTAEYEDVGPHNSASVGDTAMGAYQQPYDPEPYGHPPHDHQQAMQRQQDASSQMESQLMYHDDERSRQSASFQREVEEEGAFVDTQQAPLDEAIGMRLGGTPSNHQHGIDPPERKPLDPEIDDSVVASEAMSGTNANNSVSYYNGNTDANVSNAESPYSANDGNFTSSPVRGDAPSYGGDTAAHYSYTASPNRMDAYHQTQQEQSRDDHFYDSPEALQNQAGSQDHEFFNAHSGGGEEDEDVYTTDMMPSFDPGAPNSFDGHVGMHPDDQRYAGGEYYDDEPSPKMEVQESSSVEYFHDDRHQPQYHPEDSMAPPDEPSPINTDHLRRLGRKNEHVTSPASQASSQDYSHSSAMRGAQELLKRNRQRRHEQARRRLNANSDVRAQTVEPESPRNKYAFSPDNQNDYRVDNSTPSNAHHRGDDGSTSTWDESNNSEALTSVISGSSVWTDNSTNPADRSSRRALILQMAKARMKSNKDRDPAETTIKEEKSGSLEDDASVRQQESNDFTATELDFAADLD